MKAKILYGVIGLLIVVWAGAVLAQSENQAINLAKEGKTIFDNAKSKDDYQRAAQKYEEALRISERVKSDRQIGVCSYQLGVIQLNVGQYQKLQKEDVRNPSGKLLCRTTTRGKTLKCEVRLVKFK